MATPLTDAINALTTYANTVTGESDTCLSDAVATLADGYGGGGGSVEEGTFTISADTRTATINHSLGHVPKFCVFWCDDLASAVTADRFVSGFGVDLGVSVQITSSASKALYDTIVNQSSDGRFWRQNITSTAYGFTVGDWKSTSVSCVTNNASKYWKLGNYHYVIG